MPWVDKWEDKVAEWQSDEVTKAFMDEVAEDLTNLQQQLIESDDPIQVRLLQGMCRALMGVLGMPQDGIKPLTKSE